TARERSAGRANATPVTSPSGAAFRVCAHQPAHRTAGQPAPAALRPRLWSQPGSAAACAHGTAVSSPTRARRRTSTAAVRQRHEAATHTTSGPFAAIRGSWPASAVSLTSYRHAFELTEEAIHTRRPVRGIGRVIRHQPLGQLRGQLSDFRVQLANDLLALGDQEILTALPDPFCLAFRTFAHLFD